MSDNPIDKLECQLESLVEGAILRLFRRAIDARDIAVLVLRAIEDIAGAPRSLRDRPTAPDCFQIQMNPALIRDSLAEFPDRPGRLSRFIVSLSDETDFAMSSKPTVLLSPDERLTALNSIITANIAGLRACKPPGCSQ